MARRDASTPGGEPPPAALRPILQFHGRLPPRALATVRRVLDADDDFRARVSAEVTESSAERATWLFLTRPEGWRDEFDLLAEAAADGAARAEAEREERAASRRVEQLEDALAKQRAELDRQVAATERASDSLESEREHRRVAEREATAGRERAAASEAARADAVRQLAEARALAEARLTSLRDLEGRVASLEAELATARAEGTGTGAGASAAPSPTATAPAAPTPTAPPDPWSGADPAAVADAVRRAAQAAADLGATLDEAARALAPGGGASRGAATATPPPGDRPRPRRARRQPVRLTRGAVEGDQDATDQVLRTAGVTVVVDGYNVSMQAWPSLAASAQRERLVALLSDVASRTGADVHVVFDGDDDGRRPAVSAPLPVRVHFTAAGVEADDVVLEMVGRLPADRPVVVVSSDRRVQTGARERGASVVPSGALLDWARR